MNIEFKWKPIKLRAEDDGDLQIFSQCLYEAIVLPSEIKYDKRKKQFAMALERFTWEASEGKDHMLLQVLCILVVNGVMGIEAKKINQINKIKNLLSISNVDNNILILLNDKKIQYGEYFFEGKASKNYEEYNSFNTNRLSEDNLEELLASIGYK